MDVHTDFFTGLDFLLLLLLSNRRWDLWILWIKDGVLWSIFESNRWIEYPR